MAMEEGRLAKRRRRRRQRRAAKPSVGQVLGQYWRQLLVYGVLAMSALLILVGVTAIYWPAGLIAAGVVGILACLVDLERPRARERRRRGE